jgi:acetoin utilization protein AcuB
MRVAEIMTTRVETVPPGESATAAVARMRSARIHHLVVMERGKVVGVVSARDLSHPESGGARRGATTVGELMNSATVCAGPEMPLHRAANVLRGRSIGCLPVVDGRKLLGILTISDLLEVLGRRSVPGRDGRRSPWRRGARTWSTRVPARSTRR